MNNKGFAITGIIYTLILLFFVLIMGALSIVSTRKKILSNIKDEVLTEISENNVELTTILDNLVFSFDAVENLELSTKGIVNNNVLKDLSPNERDVTISLEDNYWNYNHITLLGANGEAVLPVPLSEYKTSDSYTLEITFKLNEIIESVNQQTTTLLGTFNPEGTGIYLKIEPEETRNIIIGSSIKDSSNEIKIESEKIGNINSIFHVVMKNDPDLGYNELYINGELISRETIVPINHTASRVLGINLAESPNSTDELINASINLYSARIYNDALTSEEVMRNYLIEALKY